MPDRKTFTFFMMDAPFDSARTLTALRLVDIALRRGHDVQVFAYQGHATRNHHPLPRIWIAALVKPRVAARRTSPTP